MAEPTHQNFTGQFSLYAGVLSGASARSFLSRHWREPISFGWTVTDSAYTRRNSNSDWLTEAGLWLNAGTMYGTEGERIHALESPARTTLAEGLKRFAGFVRNL